jgi:hypothetical protein
MRDYDVIIIGGGPSGLYAAEKLIEQNPALSILILEKNKRLGGRAFNAKFHGVEIQTGAGIGRGNYDHLLKKWCQKYNIETNPVQPKTLYWLPGEEDPLPIVTRFKTWIKTLPLPTPEERSLNTFKQWITHHWTDDETILFQFFATFDDYLHADIIDTIDNYHWQDVSSGASIFFVPWNRLINASKKYLKSKGVSIRTNTHVTRIDEDEEHQWMINGEQFSARYIILAITKPELVKLFYNNPSTLSLLDNIQTQPFVRAYVQFTGEINHLEKTIKDDVVCDEPFRKIITINQDKRIYMIAYCSNESTDFWVWIMKYHRRKEYQCSLIANTLEQALQLSEDSIHINDCIIFYHEHGTHWYTPLPTNFNSRKDFLSKVTHPAENIVVVGEAVALNQGWTNSALKTVHTIL